MKTNDVILAMGATTLILAATQLPAQSARHCAPRDVVVERLAEKYGESRQSIGLGGNNSLVEVFASPDTGSWTITMTMPNGVTCLMATGRAYETLADALPAKGDDV